MELIAMKYLKDHDVGTSFDNQRDLAEKLDTIGKRDILESERVNPLTVRLCNAKNAFAAIDQFHKKLAPRSFPQVIVEDYSYQGPQPPMEYLATAAPSGSIQSYATWPLNKTDCTFNVCQSIPGYHLQNDMNNSGIIRLIDLKEPAHEFDIHVNIYTFFANLESTLDRLRLELNSIYFDGCKVIDPKQSKGNKYWKDYLDQSNSRVRKLVSSDYKTIADLITDSTISAGLYDRISKYRNRIVHDGIINVRLDYAGQRTFLPDTPDDDSSPCNTELEPYLRGIFNDLSALLKSVYNQVLLDINAKPNLPLIV